MPVLPSISPPAMSMEIKPTEWGPVFFYVYNLSNGVGESGNLGLIFLNPSINSLSVNGGNLGGIGLISN